MSNFEHNKGKLIPLGIVDEDRAKRLISKDLPHYYDSYLECLKDDSEQYGICVIKGDFYQIEFEIDRGEMIQEFADVSVSENGVISFSTQHYNGGAHWTEVVEDAMPKTTHK